MSDHTTIKTKFSLGPLVLKVEKEFGRAAKKELRSATATTAEMSGKLSLRVLHGGAATLHSIRVLQPKQVRRQTGKTVIAMREYAELKCQVNKEDNFVSHVRLYANTEDLLRYFLILTIGCFY